jgi:hypothetical protein
MVPLSPAKACLALSSEAIKHFLPGFDSANFTAALTLGSMLPGANCPRSEEHTSELQSHRH